MDFSAVSKLSSLSKISLLLLINIHSLSLYAMEEECNGSSHDLHCNFSNAFEIKAIARFHTRDGKEKDFARYIVPRSLDYDLEGNVHTADVRNISIKTDKYPPMFNVFIEPVAINLHIRQMKLSCTTINQYDQTQAITLEAMIPIDQEYTLEVPIGLNDETGNLVQLLIETSSPRVD